MHSVRRRWPLALPPPAPARVPLPDGYRPDTSLFTSNAMVKRTYVNSVAPPTRLSQPPRTKWGLRAGLTSDPKTPFSDPQALTYPKAPQLDAQLLHALPRHLHKGQAGVDAQLKRRFLHDVLHVALEPEISLEDLDGLGECRLSGRR